MNTQPIEVSPFVQLIPLGLFSALLGIVAFLLARDRHQERLREHAFGFGLYRSRYSRAALSDSFSEGQILFSDSARREDLRGETE